MRRASSEGISGGEDLSGPIPLPLIMPQFRTGCGGSAVEAMEAEEQA